MKLNKILLSFGAFAIAASFTSCSDSDSEPKSAGDNPLYNGISEQVLLAPTVNKSYKIVKTPAQTITPAIDWAGTVRAREIAKEDFTVKFIIDNTLVDSINAQKDADYAALPDGIASLAVEMPFVDEEEAETASRAASEALLTLSKGTNVSDGHVKVILTDDQTLLAQLEANKAYVIPVRMSEVVSGPGRLARSGSNISYLTFSVSEELINPNGNPTGTIVPVADRSGWSATLGGGAMDWYGWSSPLNEDGGYNFGNYPAGSYVIFDFAETLTFDGIYSYPYYGVNSYSMFRNGTELFISNDGESWTSLGTLSKYCTTVSLYGPVSARYLKVQLGSSIQIATTAFSLYVL